MKSTRLTLLLLLALPLCSATLPRTFVSASGDDGADCSRDHPCQTFNIAVGKTTAGGEIDAIDRGDYGSVSIDRGITIDGGGFATITGYIQILGGASGSTVILRNLSLNTVNSISTVAIHNFPVDILRLEHVVITGSAGAQVGILCAGATCSLNDVRISNIRSGGGGVAVQLAGGKLSLNNCNLANNDTAISATAGVLEVDSSMIQSNTVGVSSASPATIRLSNTTVTGNTTGLTLSGSGAAIISYSNNRIFGNTTNGNPTLLTTQK
ncbi:MAG TPA: hypothetical protein VG456_25985 [Candidatus Sulfopaludibacter sp.]|nr:hypothetical protein [Candidatus Sulfopaludibacter sp.]